MRAKAVCSEPGCAALTDRGKCEQHRLEARRESDRRRPQSQHRGYDTRWHRIRARYLRAHPACEECGLQAKHVDHVRALSDGGTHDSSNLRALCHRCHSRRTARDQPGGWAAR